MIRIANNDFECFVVKAHKSANLRIGEGRDDRIGNVDERWTCPVFWRTCSRNLPCNGMIDCINVKASTSLKEGSAIARYLTEH